VRFNLDQKTMNAVKTGLRYICVFVFVAVMVLPLLWIFLTSIKTNPQAAAVPPLWIFEPDWTHYQGILFSTKFNLRNAFINSLIVTFGTTGLSLLFSFPAAYSISRFNTGGKNLAYWILSFRMLPPVVFIIPMFVVFFTLNLLDTHIGLIILYMIFNVPFAVWILKSFIDELPSDFEEAAMVDGCTRIGAMLRVALPLTIPGIVTAAIMCFFFSFNEFLFAYVFTSERAITMPAMAAVFITQYTWLWADLCASMILMMMPMVIFAFVIQRRLVRGLTMGALKG